MIDDDEDDFVITRDIIQDIPGRSYVIEWAPSFEEGLRLIKEKIRVDLQRFFRKRSGLRPLVLPVIMEI